MTSRLPRGWVPPVAAHQFGLFTPAQALAAGATSAQIRRRRGSGRWRTVVGDALMEGGEAAEPWRRAQGAALTWPDAIVCLASAALLYQLPVPDDGTVHVIVPNRRASRGGLVSHRLALGPRDVVGLGLARVTSLDRTLVDCIGRLPKDAAERLVTWAGTRERINRAALAAAVDARPGAWGNPQRRRALEDLATGAYNAAERRLQAILRQAGIAGWDGDQRLQLEPRVVIRADVLFHRERLVLEVDGFEAHGRRQFQADRTRQNALVAAGYTVLRFTWWDLVDRPADVARQVRSTLARLAQA